MAESILIWKIILKEVIFFYIREKNSFVCQSFRQTFLVSLGFPAALKSDISFSLCKQKNLSNDKKVKWFFLNQHTFSM